MISKDEWVWMPHAGHLCVGQSCRFRLNTRVGKYLISTVGEYVPDSAVRKIHREMRGRLTDLKGDAEEADYGFEEIGLGRKYETMVFKARKSEHKCCPWEIDGTAYELDMEGYNDPKEAYEGHLKLCEKYAEL